jgi:hypothetical protein
MVDLTPAQHESEKAATATVVGAARRKTGDGVQQRLKIS